MRKGPATTYPIVKKDISKNSSVTLYELQGDWWFLKCGNNYGYIRKDMIKEGKPSTSTPKPKTTAKAPTGTYQGKIVTHYLFHMHFLHTLHLLDAVYQKKVKRLIASLFCFY